MILKTQKEKTSHLLKPCRGRGTMVVGFLIYNIGFCMLLDTPTLKAAKVLIISGWILFLFGQVQNFFVVRAFRKKMAQTQFSSPSSSKPAKPSVGLACFLLAFFLFLVPFHAFAVLKPMAQIKEIDRVLKDYHKAKKGEKPSVRQIEINRKIKNRILRDDFNLWEMCRLALDQHWHKLTLEKKRAFVKLFTNLLMKNAILHSEKHSGKEKIAYLSEEKIPEMKGRILVKTRVEVPDEAVDFDVNYAMIYDKKKKRWRIYDLLLDDESLMLNYRDQFDVIISAHSYGYLVRKMRKKLHEKAVDETIQKKKTSATSKAS